MASYTAVWSTKATLVPVSESALVTSPPNTSQWPARVHLIHYRALTSTELSFSQKNVRTSFVPVPTTFGLPALSA